MAPEVVQMLMQAAVDVLAEFMPIIVIALVSWLGRKAITFWAGVRAGMPDAVREAIDNAAEVGFTFAEQIELAGRMQEFALGKFDLAMDVAQRRLKEQGYEVDLEVLEAAIENIVFNYNKENK